MPKRTEPLTNVQIRDIEPLKKEMKLFDGKGLYLLVTPAGGKLWRLKYRFAGKEKKLALGAYPETSLAEARQKREEARLQIVHGIDPAEARKRQKGSNKQTTLEKIAREWHEQFAHQWAKKNADKILSQLKLNVFPFLGNKPIAEIKVSELLIMLRRIETRGASLYCPSVAGDLRKNLSICSDHRPGRP